MTDLLIVLAFAAVSLVIVVGLNVLLGRRRR
jgi:preprotein translocase subunit SecE